MAKQKIHTIWQFGIAFFENKWDMDNFHCHDIVYQGIVDEMPRDVASGIAEIHPGFQEYFEMAMMPLYKLYRDSYGKAYRIDNKDKGTESPVQAIKSKRGPKELDHDFVIVWRVVEPQPETTESDTVMVKRL